MVRTRYLLVAQFQLVKQLFDSAWAFRLRCPATQNNLISKFTKMVSAIESTIDQTRQPGMKRTCVRSPDRFQITNIAHTRCPAERALKQAFAGS
jgi:hypothetical protein